MAAAAFTAWAIDSRPDPPRQVSKATRRGSRSCLGSATTTSSPAAGRASFSTGLIALSVLVGLVPALLRQRRLAYWIVVGAALLSIGWSVRAETAASRYSNDFSQLFYDEPSPAARLGRRCHRGSRAVYLGQKIADPNGIWSMEFWNRNVRKVWSLDGTAPGPGPRHTPSLAATDGRLAGDPGYAYVVIDNGVTIAGTTVAEKGQLRLVRIESAAYA